MSKRSLNACVPGWGGAWRVGSHGIADCGRLTGGGPVWLKSVPPNIFAPGVFERFAVDFFINSCAASKSPDRNGSDSSSFWLPLIGAVAEKNGSLAWLVPNGSVAGGNALNVLFALAGKPNGSAEFFCWWCHLWLLFRKNRLITHW